MLSKYSNTRPTLSDALLNEREVAALTTMSVASLRRWRLQGDAGPKFIKVGGSAVRYRLSDVEAWLSSQPSGGQQIQEVK
jgi:predicted DNA-binding transcriptional regulator AlpA